MKGDWEDVEPGWSFVTQESVRLFRRARPRFAALLLIGVLSSTAFMILRELMRPPFQAQLILRIVESDHDLTTALRPPREYKDFIWSVCLSGPRIQKIIEQHKLYPSLYARDPQLAIEALRDDLEIEIWGNYFDPEYFDPDEARTARVSITWPNQDPDLALTVVREIAATIEKEQADERNDAFRAGGQDAADVADRAEDQLIAVRQALVRAEIESAHATPERKAQLAVSLRSLRIQALALEHATNEVNKEATRVEFQAAWEKASAGIRFELIEPGVVLPRRGAGALPTLATALVVLVGTFAIGGLLVGAFALRVREPADIARLGLPLLGSVPAFAGDRVGSLAARLRTEDRLRLGER